MKERFLLCGVLLAATLFNACSDDDVQDNPHFEAGGTNNSHAGAASAGENGFSLDQGGADTRPNGPSGGAPPDAPGGATNVGSGGAEPTATGNAGAAAGGAATEQPPYDCVLHPTTHAEIINACTDATRIEKHPVLPPIP